MNFVDIAFRRGGKRGKHRGKRR